MNSMAWVDPTAEIGPDCVIHPFAFIGAHVVLGRGVEVFPGAMLGKEPKGAGATARQTVTEPYLSIGDHSVVGPNAVIYYGTQVGSYTLIGDSASIREQCTIGDRCIISRCVTLNYNCHVGHRTKVMDLTHLTGNMTVGDDVFISIHVSTVNDNDLGSKGYDAEQIAGPTIENGAMVGAGAILLPGVRIGQQATVAAGSLVTRDVLPGVTVMGIPARVRNNDRS